jgi:vesicle-associated membrane protein 7
VDGNFEEIARQILKKASDIPSKKTFTAQNYMFHVQNDRGVTFLCVAEAELGHRIPYAFLNDVKDR